MNPAFLPVGNSILVVPTTVASTAFTLPNGCNAVRIKASNSNTLVAFGSDSSVAVTQPSTSTPANGVLLPNVSEIFGVGPAVQLSLITMSTSPNQTVVVTGGIMKGQFQPQGNSQLIQVTTSASAALQLSGGTQTVRVRNTSPVNPVYVAFGTSTVVAVNETTGTPANGIMLNVTSAEKFDVAPNCWFSFISTAAGPTPVYITQGFGR